MAAENLFQQYAQPVKSVADYSNDMDAQDMRRQQLVGATRQNALAALVAQQTQQTMAETAADRAALSRAASGWNADTPAEARIAALRNSGRPGLMTQADALEKSWLDRRKTDADVGKTTTETGEIRRKALLQQAAGLATPADAMAMIDEGVRGGAIPMQAATLLGRMVRADPQWQLKLMMGIADPSKMADMLKPHLQTVDVGNAKVQQRVDPLTGVATTTGQQKVFQSPDNAATVGASMANAAAVRDAAKTTGDATRAAANTQRDQASEMKLADDYRAQSKEFGQAQSAHKQLTATLGSATTSPAGTLAAATKFMKILDPGSVVRESELGMALAASGILDRAANYVSTLQSGQKLTATQAKDFKDISDKMYVAAQQVQQTIDADYKAKAKAYGLRPEMVTQDLGQNAKTVNWGDLK